MRCNEINGEIPIGTVQRLCVYRRILFAWSLRGKSSFFSHELADEADFTAAQVRRDLMALNAIGTPKNGYGTADIIVELGAIIEGESGQNIVLIGVGNLGSAILGYFVNRRPDLKIVDVFDSDPEKIGKVFANCKCWPLSQLEEKIKERGVSIGILTVPADAAQAATDALVSAGIKSIVNFTPVKLRVAPDVFIEELDISIALEKAAYFAQKDMGKHGKNLKKKKGANAKKILCIEDDTEIVASYKTILETAGYEIEVEIDGTNGYKRAMLFQPDLIIIDVMKTVRSDGSSVVDKIRTNEKLKNIPILMLSSMGRNAGHKFNLKLNLDLDIPDLPTDKFMEKPIAPNSLLVTVKSLLTLNKDKNNINGILT